MASKAHPGFSAVAAKIGQKSGIRNPGAVLAAATRKASPAAKKANPRLKKVKMDAECAYDGERMPWWAEEEDDAG